MKCAVLCGVLSLTLCQAQVLLTREEVKEAPKPAVAPPPVITLAAGTKIPLELVQPVSTKNAQPGDPIYAKTTFPIVAQGAMAIPAGTWVQGTIDSVLRAGRIKGKAELQFHVTTLTFGNGQTVDLVAALDNVPGDQGQSMKEGGVVRHDSEIGRDLKNSGTYASQAGMIGSIAGAAAQPSWSGVGKGGLVGITAGVLIAILERGSDVRFDVGSAVEISLTKPVLIDRTATTAVR